ncbi:hypothetical protein KDL44_08325 [bacterium]|nr:hypothetical protein [bacterium]
MPELDHITRELILLRLRQIRKSMFRERLAWGMFTPLIFACISLAMLLNGEPKAWLTLLFGAVLAVPPLLSGDPDAELASRIRFFATDNLLRRGLLRECLNAEDPLSIVEGMPGGLSMHPASQALSDIGPAARIELLVRNYEEICRLRNWRYSDVQAREERLRRHLNYGSSFSLRAMALHYGSVNAVRIVLLQLLQDILEGRVSAESGDV